MFFVSFYHWIVRRLEPLAEAFEDATHIRPQTLGHIFFLCAMLVFAAVFSFETWSLYEDHGTQFYLLYPEVSATFMVSAVFALGMAFVAVWFLLLGGRTDHTPVNEEHRPVDPSGAMFRLVLLAAFVAVAVDFLWRLPSSAHEPPSLTWFLALFAGVFFLVGSYLTVCRRRPRRFILT